MKKNNQSETSSSVKDKKDSTKSPIIISQISGNIDSTDNQTNEDYLLTVLELNDGQPKLDRTESLPEKPKKFRINLVKHKKDLESRKSQLIEERDMIVHRLKRFPGYIINNIMCVNQGDFEVPSKSTVTPTTESPKPQCSDEKSKAYSKHAKPKVEKPTVKKAYKYSTPEDALKFFENLIDVKIKSEEDFDKEMVRRFPLGKKVIKSKWHFITLYIPDCELLRKSFIDYYSLNKMKMTNDSFEQWCQKNAFFNSKWMYESYYINNGDARDCTDLLSTLMIKYHVGIVLSDFFRNRDFAAYRAVVIFSDSLNNVILCAEDFKSKLPINIIPYLHENPDDDNILAPNDFEEIDYFRRNYHRLMFSEDVFF